MKLTILLITSWCSVSVAATSDNLCGKFSQRPYIATYDHSQWWWNPSQEKTVAVYNPELFSMDPNQDSSLQFYNADNPPKRVKIPEIVYEDFIVERGFTMQRPPLDGENYVITGDEKYHKFESGFGDYAWDIVRVNERGSRFLGMGRRNEDYLVWGESVYSPVTGYVFEVIRDQPDRAPGPVDLQAKNKNNSVGIYLGGGYYVYLLHFQNLSIPESIKPGVRVQVGDFLGLVGNSGVTEEPHLHMTLMFWDRVHRRFWSVPSGFSHVAVKDKSGNFTTTSFINPREGTVLKNLRHPLPSRGSMIAH